MWLRCKNTTADWLMSRCHTRHRHFWRRSSFHYSMMRLRWRLLLEAKRFPRFSLRSFSSCQRRTNIPSISRQFTFMVSAVACGTNGAFRTPYLMSEEYALETKPELQRYNTVVREHFLRHKKRRKYTFVRSTEKTDPKTYISSHKRVFVCVYVCVYA